MARVIITKDLEEEINKKFKRESVKIFSLLLTLEKNPKKGDFLGNISGIAIKELKYKKFRFYFLTDNYKLKYLRIEELRDLMIKFIRMSEKKDQRKTINEIKKILKKI
jgi:hypothetical protein